MDCTEELKRNIPELDAEIIETLVARFPSSIFTSSSLRMRG